MSHPSTLNRDRAERDWLPVMIAGAYQTVILAVCGLLRRRVRASSFGCNFALSGFRNVYGSSPHLAPLEGKVETSMDLDDVSHFEWLVEVTGSQVVLPTLLQRASTGATLLLLSLPYSDQILNFEAIVAFDRSVIGSVGSSSADFDQASATLRRLDTATFVWHCYALSQYEAAFEKVRSRICIKVMPHADRPLA